jgi:hypothetical protein
MGRSPSRIHDPFGYFGGYALTVVGFLFLGFLAISVFGTGVFAIVTAFDWIVEFASGRPYLTTVIVILVFLLMGFLVYLKITFEHRRNARWAKQAEERAMDFVKAAEADHERKMQQFSLNCRGRGCGKLARPIPGTGNRYRCDHCGRQFAQSRHHL